MLKSTLTVTAGLAALIAIAQPAAAQDYGRRAQCDDYARRIAYRQGGDAGNVVGGAVAGAILGGAVGAITGNGHGSNVATGAAIGGVTGGAVGAASSQPHYDQQAYNRAYWRCMNSGDQGGYAPQPAYNDGGYNHGYGRHARFRAMQYCASKYRSYNPQTGMYLSSSGQYRHCP